LIGEQQKAIVARLEWVLKRAERNLANTVLKAPFAGFVTSVNAQIGRHVGINDRIATLIDRGQMDVRFSLSDRQYARLLQAEGKLFGRPVTVRWQTDAAPLEFHGIVDRVGAEISAATGGVSVMARLNVSASGHAALRPGAFVDVLMKDRLYKNVAAIPESALFERDTVYVIRDKRLKARKVRIIGYDDARVLVRGDLAADEQLLVTHLNQAGNDLLVAVQKP
jgi:RND family efflux transporter MFP subunit